MIKRICAITVILFALTACNHGQAPVPATSVKTEKPKQENIINSSSYAGKVTTVEVIELLPRIQGYLQERRFEQGQMVKPGDVLFVIEPDQYEAIVLQKKADLSAAEATLAERSLNYERMQILFEKKVAAKANLDQAQSDYSNALANVQAAQATLRNAELDLSYTTITAPIAGRIGVTQFSPGDYLSANTSTLTTIVQLDPIRVVFSIPEKEWLTMEMQHDRNADNLNSFLKPELKLSNGSMYDSPGEISFIDNHIDTNTGSLAVYATFENPKFLLLPGQFVTVIIEQGKPRSALLVPNESVLLDKTGHYVLLVTNENKVEQRYVKTGITQNNQIEITEGLSPDEQVITEGLQKVKPGMTVAPPTPKPTV